MEAKTTLAIALPVDDGAIARGFADLSEKMSRLMSAIGQAGTAMTRAAERASTPRTIERGESAHAGPGSGSEALNAAVESCPAESTPCVNSRIFVDELATSEASPEAAVTDLSTEQARVGNAEQDLALAEDEALLASLDPETAGVLRVKRRLTGGRKRVKELLEEYQATHGKPADAPRKKSWWKGNR